MERIYIYARFERFWHWLQALQIVALIATGLELHGTYTLLGYETAHDTHIWVAWSWIVLYAFAAFWLVTTGEWKQYKPTLHKMAAVARHYAIGIFRGEPHPVPKSQRAKHNPLQRLTYLGILTFLLPFQMVTGLLYLYYNDWPAWGISWSLGPLAVAHTLGAFAMLAFVVVHVYMTTTGHTLFCHLKAMCTGWEEVEHPEEIEEWEKRKQPA